MKWLALFICIPAFAGVSFSGKSYDYDFNKKSLSKTVKKRVYKKKKDSTKMNILLRELERKDQEIHKLLIDSQNNIIVRGKEEVLKPLTRIRGILLNSIVATNNKPEKLLIQLYPNEFFEDAKARCHGIVYNRRVSAKCNLVVGESKNYSISGELWDNDGANGLIPADYYNGSEKEFLTSSVASFFKGVLHASKSNFVTQFGEFQKNTNRNTGLSGLEAIAENANSIIKQSGNQNIEVALLNSGREVILYFDEEVKL